MSQPKAPRNWISRRAAALMLEIDPARIPIVAGTAGIRIRQIPGMAPQYNAADVARVLAESVAPAMAGGGRGSAA